VQFTETAQMRTESYLTRLATKTIELLDGHVVLQAAALCIRVGQSGEKRLLLSSRGTGRWVIPKGTIEQGETARECAEREAFEEAGITGKVSKRPVGYYTYIKEGKPQPLVVSVFTLKVKGEHGKFREKGQRSHSWVSMEEASTLVDEPELKRLFLTALEPIK
jgi:8-oxo-dGTP pyrophosphatase MutT (NUDIX family)